LDALASYIEKKVAEHITHLTKSAIISHLPEDLDFVAELPDFMVPCKRNYFHCYLTAGLYMLRQRNAAKTALAEILRYFVDAADVVNHVKVNEVCLQVVRGTIKLRSAKRALSRGWGRFATFHDVVELLGIFTPHPERAKELRGGRLERC
jgi:hypothetical protein